MGCVVRLARGIWCTVKRTCPDLDRAVVNLTAPPLSAAVERWHDRRSAALNEEQAHQGVLVRQRQHNGFI